MEKSPSQQNITDWRRQIWTVSQAQEIDRRCIEDFHLSGLALMETAGHKVAAVAKHHYPERKNILVLAGPGNNGGDGAVAARILHQHGCNVSFYLVSQSQPAKLSVSCQQQLQTLETLGIEIRRYSYGCLSAFRETELIVIDAVLGLGVRGPLRKGPVLDCLTETANLPRKVVIAVDLPSGMDGDRWQDGKLPLPADVTITFGEAKPAHIMQPSASACGEVLVDEIGFLQTVVHAVNSASSPRVFHATRRIVEYRNPWSRLGSNIHKYDRGHVLVIGGSEGKWGAPLLAALAAQRTGAGWVSLAVPDANAAREITALHPQLTHEPLFANGKIDASAMETFLRQRKVRAMVIGPGTIGSPLTQELLIRLAEIQRKTGLFLVFDAGACQMLLKLARSMPVPFVVERTLTTPHPGEWLKLDEQELPCRSVSDLGMLQRVAIESGITLMFKGATPLIVNDRDATIVAFGSPALAKAGSGDLLSGIVAAYAACDYSATLAASVSLRTLSAAAELAAMRYGIHALGADDICHAIGLTIA